MVMSSTRAGEMARTAELLEEVATRAQQDPLRVAIEVLFIIRSANCTTESDLKDLQKILDEKWTKRRAK